MALAGNQEEGAQVMKEWSVELEALAPAPDEELAARLIDCLAGRGPAVSLEHDRVSVRVDMEAETILDALREARHLLHTGFPDLEIVGGQVEAVDELERRLQQSNAPELLGVAEIADALGVTKQRVTQLAAGESFPAPVARLKSGPVWQRSALARFMRSWKRTPGRPTQTKH